MVASVGSPPSISRAGAEACTTPSSHVRQAYFGRIVTSPRNCAGTISSRSLLSSPIRCNAPWQQRQVLSSRSMVVSIRGRCAGSAPRLARRFAAPACRAAPNRKWIADFTYVWTAEGWLYVAAVVDLFSRRVVGWSMNAAMTAQLVTDALAMAIWRRGKPDALLHHSDRDSQYTSEQFQRLMADHGVVCSMSRSGNVWDNAAMESFFSSLKTERTARKVYRTRDDAKGDVFDYF